MFLGENEHRRRDIDGTYQDEKGKRFNYKYRENASYSTNCDDVNARNVSSVVL